MSNHRNHRRDEHYRTEHGPRYMGGHGGLKYYARGRSRWKRLRARIERREHREAINQDLALEDFSDPAY